MTQRVFLHVGLPKSGTTYLQGLLEDNKPALADLGLLFPGDTWEDQVRATRDVRDMSGYEDSSGAWAAMVEEIHSWPGDAVVSMEWLCAADAPHVRRIVDDLAPSRVTVVFTVRDIARALPSAWQEMMKNCKSWSWPDFLTAVSADDPWSTRPGRRFWVKVDVAAMLDTWSTAVETADIVVVTVPPVGAPHDLLWRRMCAVMGIDPGEYARSTTPRNQSLGVESTEVMRRLNDLYRSSSLTRKAYDTSIKKLLAQQILSSRRHLESRLRVPEAYQPWARAAAARQVEAIDTRGVRVVGDLDELRPTFPSEGVDDPGQVDPEHLLEASLHAVLGMVEEHQRLLRDLERTERQRDRLRGRLRGRGRGRRHAR
jgi:hypothetical protein